LKLIFFKNFSPI